MIKFEHTEVVGWEAAIRGMRNPLESWEKSDSGYREESTPFIDQYGHVTYEQNGPYLVGPNDLSLMTKLRNAGTDHRKFMRMITVYVDITAPLYWWKEFDTYKVGTVANSCSTMHTIHKKEFTLDDFSHEHLLGYDEFDLTCDLVVPMVHPSNDVCPRDILSETVVMLNAARERYLETKDKKYWWQMIQLLPTSYNQKRTVMLNYEVLANIYKSRKDHKLDEWHDFCDWIKELPYSELIVGKTSQKNYTFSDAATNLKSLAKSYEKQHTPSPEEVNELFKNVMKVDGRVKSYRVYDKMGMKILDFYDANHKSLYAFDLYRVTLDEALLFVKQEIVKLTRQNLELGA